MVVGKITDQIIEEMTVTRCMVIEIRTMIGLEKGMEIGEIAVAQEKVPNPGVVVDLKADIVGVTPEIETDLN